ncbi:hypothetical protein MFFC18_31610 [Mariniblastus fucicola]|uniref:Uncharacterized protein n=1 Tax=Mariniblastus fucicola TaxID=980251 RepID=A0A5B9PDJ6_9BACT|nr:hypothetical protein MFFC18_31610 [Mariniblastus fucicola]
MIQKTLLGLALCSALIVTPFAFASFNAPAPTAACECCGDACECDVCVCDANGCACDTGGDCFCTIDCCAVCCDD